MPTMAKVKDAIEAHRRVFAELPFFRKLEASSEIEDLRRFVPHLYFFVFAFQDMLRLAHEGIRDPTLRAIAERHRAEDAGHDAWFASDVAQLGCERDVQWIFSDEHRITRDFCYELVGEILHTEDDNLRLVFPLILESAGSVFFARVVDLVRRCGYSGPLRYFARSHQQVEQAHDMLTPEGQREIDELPLDPTSLVAATALVDRCFDACERMAAHLESHRGSSVR